MEFTPVQSTMESEIEQVSDENSKIEALKKEMVKRIEYAQRFRTGKLTLKEYKALRGAEQRLYNRAFGRPKTKDEKLALAKKRRRNATSSKMAKKARKTNRSR